MDSETELQKAILEALREIGCWVFRVNSGRYGKVWLAPEGTPDLCLPALGWMEVKLPGRKPSVAQQVWHKRAENEGVRVAVVHSVTEAISTYLAWR